MSSSREWQLRGKWEAFYDGTFAPHLHSTPGTLEQLPWRSGEPSTPLVEYVAAGRLPANNSVIEVGCGTGENLAFLASWCHCPVVGVDICEQALEEAWRVIDRAGLQANVRTLQANVLDLPSELIGQFDFVLDCQTFHCVRKVDEAGAAAALASLLRPGGRLFLLTGNADEPHERGPERLTQAELQAALEPAGFTCEECVSFMFDQTDAYRKQPYHGPPLGWRSVWCRN